MSDPSLLVTNPSRSDPDLAPDGKHIYYVLFPTPNLDSPIDWSLTKDRYRDEVIRTLEERGYVGFGDAIEVEDITTPQDWADRGMERGAPFASAHSFLQTGPFRPGNMWGENVVFTGSGTQPGVGVPMVLVSGRLAAERITGPDRRIAPAPADSSSMSSRIWTAQGSPIRSCASYERCREVNAAHGKPTTSQRCCFLPASGPTSTRHTASRGTPMRSSTIWLRRFPIKISPTGSALGAMHSLPTSNVGVRTIRCAGRSWTRSSVGKSPRALEAFLHPCMDLTVTEHHA